MAQPPSPFNLAIPGQILRSLGHPWPKLEKLFLCVTNQVKFSNFSAHPPIPLNLAIPGQNLSSLRHPLSKLANSLQANNKLDKKVLLLHHHTLLRSALECGDLAIRAQKQKIHH